MYCSIYVGQDRPKSPPTSGLAKVTYPNGDIYEGNFEGNLRHGKGIMKFFNGRQYRGKWRLDLVSKEPYILTIEPYI